MSLVLLAASGGYTYPNYPVLYVATYARSTPPAEDFPMLVPALRADPLDAHTALLLAPRPALN